MREIPVDVDVKVLGPIGLGDVLGVEWVWENAEGIEITTDRRRDAGKPVRLVVTVTSMGSGD